jgi:hypothetical protein
MHPRQEQNVSLIRQCYKLAPGHEAKQWLRQRPALSYYFVSQSVYWPAGNKLPVEHQKESDNVLILLLLWLWLWLDFSQPDLKIVSTQISISIYIHSLSVIVLPISL